MAYPELSILFDHWESWVKKIVEEKDNNELKKQINVAF